MSDPISVVREALERGEYHAMCRLGGHDHQTAMADVRAIRAALASLPPAAPVVPIFWATPDTIDQAQNRRKGRGSELMPKLTIDAQPQYGFTVPLYAAPVAVQPAAIPGGWKLVPVEATAEMLEAAFVSWGKSRALADMYDAMMRVAPQPTVDEQSDSAGEPEKSS